MQNPVQQDLTSGHPSLEELMQAQGTRKCTDPTELLGSFWPEEESLDEFLEDLRASRGHRKTDPAA